MIGSGSYVDGGFCNPICNVYFVDRDNAGHLWFDFDGYNGSVFAAGLGEITHPTTAPKVSVILPAGTFGAPVASTLTTMATCST